MTEPRGRTGTHGRRIGFDRRRQGVVAMRGRIWTRATKPRPDHLPTTSEWTILAEGGCGCVHMLGDTPLSERVREIEAMDAEIASLEAEIWRLATHRAAMIARRCILEAAESFPMTGPVDDRDETRVRSGAGFARELTDDEGLDVGRHGGGTGPMPPATGVEQLDRLIASATPGQRAAMPRIWSMVAEAGSAGARSEDLQEIVREGVVGHAVFAKALSKLAKSGLMRFSRSDGRWTTTDHRASTL